MPTMTRNLAVNLTAVDKTRGVFGKAEKNTNRLRSSVAGLGAALGGVFAAGAIAQGIRSTITAASDMNESLSKSRVVFGDSSKAVEAFARTAAKSLGQSRQQALAAAGTFGNLFVSMGIGQKASAKMSTRLVTLASDLASFNNASPEEALDALRSGLVGETEPLRRFGINLNDAALREEALRLGLVKTTKNVLPPAAKAQAAYSLAIKQSKTAHGDFQRTAGGLANQQRIAIARWKDLQATIGAKLLPTVNKLMNVFLNRVIPGLSSAGAAVGAVVGWFKQHQGVIVPLIASLGAFTLIVSANTIATAIWSGVTRAATLASRGFVTVLWATRAAMLANPIGIIIALLAALVVGIVIAYRRSETFRKIVQAVWAGIRKAITAAWKFIKPVFMAIFRVIKTVLIVQFKILRTVAKIVWIAIRALIKAAWIVIRPIFKAIVAFIRKVLAPIFRWLWRNVIKPAWAGIGSIIKGAWNRVIRPAFDAIKKAVRKVRDAFKTAVDGIRRVWGRIKEIAKKPINFVIGIYNKGIVALVNRIAKFAGIKTRIGQIPKLARGGVMPGFAPGRDTLLANVSPGESIFRPEFTRAVGKRWVDNANRVARTEGSRGVAKFLFGVGDPSGTGLPGFALGGIVGKFVEGVKAFGNPVKLARSAMDRIIGTVPGAGIFRDVIAGIPRWIAGKIVDWVRSIKDKIFGGGSGAVVRAARSMLGLPYSWGGGGRGGPSYGIGRGANTFGFDCSGLTEFAWWKGAKVGIGGTTFTQWPNSRPIGGPRPGALGFPHRGHVMLASNRPGFVIQAPFTGSHVQEVRRTARDWRWPEGAKMDRGGMLMPGWNPPIYNGTGAPEVVIPIKGRTGARRDGALHIKSGEMAIVETPNGGLRALMRNIVVEEMADEFAFRGR